MQAKLGLSISLFLSLVQVEAWAVTEFQDDSDRVYHWTLDLEFLGIFRNGIIHFPWG